MVASQMGPSYSAFLKGLFRLVAVTVAIKAEMVTNLLFDHSLELAAGLEFDYLGSLDFDLLAGLGISSLSSSSLCHTEGTEAHQSNLVTFFQGIADSP